MKIDSGEDAKTVTRAIEVIVEAEKADFDGGMVAETRFDPFLLLTAAAARTSRIELITAVAIAFARNPMTVAMQANDLHELSGGRLVLGLGSQVETHITRRFSMPWASPAARLREFVLAVRAIWRSWETGERLSFAGEFYTHNLMTPMFAPGPNPHGNPRIYLAAVGPTMTEMAAEVADGMVCSPATTERYLREVTMPAVERGRLKAGKSAAGFEICCAAVTASGSTPAEIDAAMTSARARVAFFGSTPTYRAVFGLHGWAELHEELYGLSVLGQWDEMTALIDDEVLHTFAVVGTPTEVATEVTRRYGDIAHRVGLTGTEATDPARWTRTLAAIRSR
ncbi:TIGR03617 family F420-dependent LLM class oxidoreductase [Actinophytocola sp.]|uniref:TIGR03617 family F420-dependent LLM class oxidoreductase n=1 Tax=Actinophytocola sp. TaxID=1872138 RepID=UPI002ED84E44